MCNRNEVSHYIKRANKCIHLSAPVLFSFLFCVRLFYLYDCCLIHWDTTVFVITELNDHSILCDVDDNTIKTTCGKNGISYSKLINGLTKAGVEVNRKMLADLAISDEKAFAQLVAVAKENQ